MTICIVSDSHDRSDALAAAISAAREEGAKAVLHCGDLIGANILRASLKLEIPIHAMVRPSPVPGITIWSATATAIPPIGGECAGCQGVL